MVGVPDVALLTRNGSVNASPFRTNCASKCPKIGGNDLTSPDRLSLILSLGLAAAFLTGCSPPARLDALPSGVGVVSFLQITNARFDSEDSEALQQEIWQSLTREYPQLSNTMLALSGGQEDGAFGAGLLVGWSQQGSRPQFKIVTGTSTGALAAPFAFLGSEYDWALKKIYTETQPGDVIS